MASILSRSQCVNSWSPSHWLHIRRCGLFSILNECVNRVWPIRRRLMMTSSKTHSLQWNNCLCTLWTYSHFPQLYFPILVRQSFWISIACQKIKMKVLFYSQCGSYFCPKWSGSSVPEAGHSHVEVRQPCLYFKDSEGVFLHLFYLYISSNTFNQFGAWWRATCYTTLCPTVAATKMRQMAGFW